MISMYIANCKHHCMQLLFGIQKCAITSIYAESLGAVQRSKEIWITEDAMPKIFSHQCAFRLQYSSKIQLRILFPERGSNVSAFFALSEQLATNLQKYSSLTWLYEIGFLTIYLINFSLNNASCLVLQAKKQNRK